MLKHNPFSLSRFCDIGRLMPQRVAGLLIVFCLSLLLASLPLFVPVGTAQTPAGSGGSPTPSASASPSPAPSPSSLPGQLPGFPGLFQFAPKLETQWIRLQGTRLFQIAGHRPTLSERRRWIQANLHRIGREYVADARASLKVEVLRSNRQPVIHINGQYLLTVTAVDAQVQGLDAQSWAEQLQGVLTQSLKTTRRQYQRPYLVFQARLLAAILLGVGLSSVLLFRWQRAVRQRPVTLLDADTHLSIKRRSRLQQSQIRELQLLLLRMGQFSLWTAGGLFGLSRLPHTRALAVQLIGLLRIPLVLGVAIAACYILIRLSAIAIDRFGLALSTNPLLPGTSTARSQQRIGTISQVVKGLSCLTIALVGFVLALVVLGVNVAPLLAGAGILGIGISLASQGIIKDAINGFLIVLEDQYGVGDVIQIGDWIGLVENLNLRMTQLRNAEGKLITIPNSEIKVVANLSSTWSRVDLNLPVPYEADLSTMMALVDATARDMLAEERWQELILEPPELMGVEDFSDRGLILKLWIKTQPLKQWEVAREYRRRLKLALDQAGIPIPVPQRSFWLHSAEGQPFKGDLKPMSEDRFKPAAPPEEIDES